MKSWPFLRIVVSARRRWNESTCILKDKVHNEVARSRRRQDRGLRAARRRRTGWGGTGAQKVLQLILLEEDELLLKNLVKGVFVDDRGRRRRLDDELALAPVEQLILLEAVVNPEVVEVEEVKQSR